MDLASADMGARFLNQVENKMARNTANIPEDMDPEVFEAIPDDPFGAPAEDEDDGEWSVEVPNNRIPEASYVGKCTDVNRARSQAGNLQFVWDWMIMEGPHKGREFKTYTALTPAAMWKVTQTLKAVGIAVVKDEKGNPKYNFNRDDVINVGVTLVVKDDNYKTDVLDSKVDTVMEHPNGAGYKYELPF